MTALGDRVSDELGATVESVSLAKWLTNQQRRRSKSVSCTECVLLHGLAGYFDGLSWW